jgi:hypothetical protein
MSSLDRFGKAVPASPVGGFQPFTPGHGTDCPASHPGSATISGPVAPAAKRCLSLPSFPVPTYRRADYRSWTACAADGWQRLKQPVEGNLPSAPRVTAWTVRGDLVLGNPRIITDIALSCGFTIVMSEPVTPQCELLVGRGDRGPHPLSSAPTATLAAKSRRHVPTGSIELPRQAEAISWLLKTASCCPRCCPSWRGGARMIHKSCLSS